MLENIKLRSAIAQDLEAIWPLFAQGIEKRRLEGSAQWQDGYPNPQSIANDIDKGYGYVCTDHNNEILGYVAIIFDVEPAYEVLEGKWLTLGRYACVHRLVVSQTHKIKGLATWVMREVERIVLDNDIISIKADTNHDNGGMLRVFEKLGYIYCGKVYFRGSARQAFEKVLL
jgi:GNAT superfamily N-acetyltransferase